MSYYGGGYKPAPGPHGSGMSPSPPVPSFFDEVSSIQDMIKLAQDNISRIDELHSRSLGTVSEDEAIKRQLESLTENTRNILVQTKDKIRKLEALNLGLPPSTSDLAVRRAQTANLRERFLQTLQKYQNIEYQNRQKYRARMERQYKIVKPQATQEEIDAALDNDEGGQFFAQSLLNSTRYGAAKDALREVQERHDDIKKIEKTIAELVNLFQEMQMLVEAQDAPIAAVEEHAVQVTKDMESGVAHVEKALESAKGARKKKWICLCILIIVLIIVAAVVYLYFFKDKVGGGSSNTSNNTSQTPNTTKANSTSTT